MTNEKTTDSAASVLSAGLAPTTLCWNCNTAYPMEARQCPGCCATNANKDLASAQEEMQDKKVFRDEKQNRLYKPAMVRVTAEYNVVTREHRNARLIEFVEHDNRIDEKDLERLFQRGAKAWKDVPDASDWVERLRGNDE